MNNVLMLAMVQNIVALGQQEEDFDVSLECHSAIGNIKFSPSFIIDWNSSLSTIKDELLNALIYLACELKLDLANTVRRYPQIQLLYQKLKLRYEMTGELASISFSAADEEDMSCNAEGPWPYY